MAEAVAAECPQTYPRAHLRIASLVAGMVALTGPLAAQETVKHLNPVIEKLAAGKPFIGFQTGDLIDLSLWNVFIPVGSGSYGYNNDGAWHDVKIPVKDMLAWGAAGSGLPYPNSAALDLTKVSVPFVLADIYGTTGKPSGTTTATPIYLDNIYWSK